MAGVGLRCPLVRLDAGGGTVTYEESESGWKSETPLDWKDGKAVARTGAASAKLGIDDPLGSGDLRGIDFFPFWKTDYSKAFTSDENTQEKTVSLYADEGRTQLKAQGTYTPAAAAQWPQTIQLTAGGRFPRRR